MTMPIPKSCGKLIWVDYRVFFADMPFISVRESDHCIIQSRIISMPKEFWVECIECTYDGANMKDPWAVYDYMFDNQLTHPAVLDAVNTANVELCKILNS